MAGGPTFDEVNLEETTRCSEVTVRVLDGAETSVGDINVANSLNKIAAKTTGLRGNIWCRRALRQCCHW